MVQWATPLCSKRDEGIVQWFLSLNKNSIGSGIEWAPNPLHHIMLDTADMGWPGYVISIVAEAIVPSKCQAINNQLTQLWLYYHMSHIAWYRYHVTANI